MEKEDLKRKYQAPSMKVFNMKTEGILCASVDSPEPFDPYEM